MAKVGCVKDVIIDPIPRDSNRIRGSITSKAKQGRIPFQMSIEEGISLRLEPGDEVSFDKTPQGFAVNLKKTFNKCFREGPII